MSEQKGVNSVDLAINQLRILQGMIYDPRLSGQDLFNYTNKIIDTMNQASAEININYKEISAKLTEHMNTGRVQE